MLLDLNRITLFVEFVLLNTARVGQPRSIRGCEPWKGLRIPTTFGNAAIYHYSVLARKFIEAGRVGLTLVGRTTLFVSVVKDFEVVVVNVVASKEVDDKFKD